MNQNKSTQKVLIGLSGGVDSSVAAALLVKEGYDVTGAYMKQWSDSEEISGVCSWKEDRRDALRVAAKLGIPMLTLDFEKEYKDWVMNYMFGEYEQGRTPNPDVMCNKYIKFGAWLTHAKEQGFDYLATGHYCAITEKDGEYHLTKAKDENKDQTYFLHQVGQEELRHMMFPLGGYTKKEVREMAASFDLPTANRPESMGICFVGEVPMKEFLEQKISHKPGNIIGPDKHVLGEHDGLTFYTIGQRKIGTTASAVTETSKETEATPAPIKPLYVVEKDFGKNELHVGYEDDPRLHKKEVTLTDIHFIGRQSPALPLQCKVRTRHRQPLQEAVLTQKKDLYLLTFKNKQRALTPGQFAVFYNDTECLGGGVIV